MVGETGHNLLGDIVSSSLHQGRLGTVDISILVGTDGGLLNVKPAADIATEPDPCHISHVSLPVAEVGDAVDAVEVDF